MLPVTVRVALPDPPRTGLLVITAVMFVDEAWGVMVTVPVNPPDGVTVIVDVPWLPDVMVMFVGLAVSAKSTGDTMTVIVAVVWDTGPLVPVTVTV
jgi:hypothetical protein